MADPRPRTRRRLRLASPDGRLDLRSSTMDGGVVVITASGEIDLANRTELTTTLEKAAGTPELRLLVCDFSHVTFLACTGVSSLLDARRALDERGAILRVVATDPTVLRVLDATGQQEALGVRPHLSAALSGFVSPPALAHLRTSLDAAVEQTTSLAELCGRLAEQLAALDAARLVDERGSGWQPCDTLADMAADLRALQHHLATGALLAAPTIEDLNHLRDID